MLVILKFLSTLLIKLKLGINITENIVHLRPTTPGRDIKELEKAILNFKIFLMHHRFDQLIFLMINLINGLRKKMVFLNP